MKLWTLLASLGATAAALALTLTASGASAPIQNSKHNMNLVFGANTIRNNEICLPCHAPHSQYDPTEDYLWNHAPSANAAFTLYKATASYTGLDETSLKCLSCHDGSTAVDSYGGFSGATRDAGAGAKKLGTDADVDGVTGYQIGKNGDLSHDHPVGVIYPGMQADGTWNGTGVRFKDPTKFNKNTYYSSVITNADGSFSSINYVNNAGGNVTAVGGAGIKLAVGPGDTVARSIGCGSCHTPHTNTYGFLRFPNTNSQLCLTCHDK